MQSSKSYLFLTSFSHTSSCPLQLFPTPDKPNQLILNVRAGTLGHFHLFEVQGSQNKYQVQLFLLDLNVFSEFLPLVSVHLDMVLGLVRGLDQRWGHSVVVLYLDLGLHNLWVEVGLTGALLVDLFGQAFHFSGVHADLGFELGFFFNHDLYGVLDFSQQVAIILSVLWEFFVLSNDLL